MTEREYKQLKQQVEEAKASAERAQGALDQLTNRLKEEFECTNLKAAKALLSKLETKTASAEKELDDAVTAYKEKWKAE